jgi:ADP-heptose:LPS heptosyltransferase
MCVNTTYSRNIVCDEIALWSGAKVVVGWRGVWIDRLPVLKRRYDGMYTKLLEHIFPPNTHEMRRHEMLLDALGAKEIKLLPQFWSLESQTNEHVTEPITKALKVPKFIVLVPGADAPARRWPISHYGQIVAKLRNQYPEFQVFLVGSDKEREEIGDPASREGFEGSLDLMGKTTLLELSLLIQRSSLVFGNETGPLHIAVALGIPTVSILGGGHYGRFMPYSDGPRNRVVTNHLDCFGCNWECVRSRVECIEDVQVERVWAEVENALSENER